MSSSCVGPALALASGQIVCNYDQTIGQGAMWKLRGPYDGVYDTSFSTDGFLGPFADVGLTGIQTSLQTDGTGFLIGGTSFTQPGLAQAQAFFQRRTATGTLDTTFASTGYALHSLGKGQHFLRGMAMQTDGRAIGVGGSQMGSAFQISMYRLLTTGSLDTSFKTTGKFAVPIGDGDALGISIAVDTQGRSMVGGISTESDAKNYFAVLRFSSDGTLDTTFHTDGIVKTLFGSSTDNGAFGIALETSGRFVAVGASHNAAGSNTNNGVTARFVSDGNLDTSFNTAGFLLSNYIKQGVAIQTDGKTIVPGYQVQRVRTDGRLDTSFNPSSLINLPGKYFPPSFNERAHFVWGTYLAQAFLEIGSVNTFAAFFNSFSPLAIGFTLDQSITLSNPGWGGTITGLSGLNALSGEWSWAGGTFPGGGTCGTTLAQNATCTAVVRFTPSATGTNCADMKIPYTDGGIAIADPKSICGIGGLSGFAMSGVPYNFGTVNSGSYAETGFTLTNNTTGTITGMDGAFYGSGLAWASGSGCNGMFPGSGGTCSNSAGSGLGSGEQCTIQVAFCPTVSGALTTGAHVGVSGSGIGATIGYLSGVGAEFSIAYTGLDFGVCLTGTTCSGEVTVSNSGNGSVSGTSGILSGTEWSWIGGNYPGGGTCGTGIGSGSSCTVKINFLTNTTGSVTGAIYISGSGYSYSGGLSGTGGYITLSIGDINFGNVTSGQSASGSGLITNSGNMTVTGLAGAINQLSGGFSFNGMGNTLSGAGCPATLASGASCTYVIDFAPSGSGTYTGLMSASGGNGLSASGNLSGSGTDVIRRSPHSDSRTSHHFPTLGEAAFLRVEWLRDQWKLN